MAMVQDTQGKRWKRRIPARPARVLSMAPQEALLTSVCWLDVCPRGRQCPEGASVVSRVV
jgi:hypothetical protein